jgi:hypothetical protein
MMKLKGVKVQYGLQWCHAKDTSEHRWVTPSERYTPAEAREALKLHRGEYPHLISRVVRLETTTTAIPVEENA